MNVSKETAEDIYEEVREFIENKELIFSKDNVDLITFTDRPFRIARESMGITAERTIFLNAFIIPPYIYFYKFIET